MITVSNNCVILRVILFIQLYFYNSEHNMQLQTFRSEDSEHVRVSSSEHIEHFQYFNSTSIQFHMLISELRMHFQVFNSDNNVVFHYSFEKIVYIYMCWTLSDGRSRQSVCRGHSGWRSGGRGLVSIGRADQMVNGKSISWMESHLIVAILLLQQSERPRSIDSIWR